MIRLAIDPTFEAFRHAARPLLAAGTPPADVLWEDTRSGQGFLFGERPAPPPPGAVATGRNRGPRLAARAMRLLELGAEHRDPERFGLLYRILFRLTRDEPHLLELAADPDVARLRAMVQAVRAEEHDMHAFVRFRRVDLAGDEPWMVAWYRPEHHVLRRVAPFFQRRFGAMRWAILTPDESVHWDTVSLRFGPGVPREQAPGEDAYEDLFRTYYRAIFNPARVNLTAMRAEMPRRVWSDMPETQIVRELVRSSTSRVERMHAGPVSAAAAFVPEERSLPVLAEALRGCRACALCEHATQAVFGEAAHPLAAPRLVLVGEQPGDEEDLAGRPFVGPAGRVLDDALAAAGIDRRTAYVTNAVKHFKYEPRGKRRIHQRPTYVEVQACRAWLDAELETVRPEVIVCLGSTAAQSFLGKRFQVSKRRGQVERTRWARAWLATWHPSVILRAPEPELSRRSFEELVADLRIARAELEQPSATPFMV